jgi:RecB family exonuclease
VVPGPTWDRLAREAHVVGGREQWAERLARSRPQCDDPVELDRLRAFMVELGEAVEPGGASTWRELGAWARSLVDRYIGAPMVTATWSQPEARAAESVRACLDELAGIDLHTGAVERETFADALSDALDAPGGHLGAVGDGVFVGALDTLVGTRFDVLLVLGMVEGSFPLSAREHPFLRPGQSAAGERSERRARERRRYLEAMAAADERVLLYARADPRAGRAQRPAPWLLEAAAVAAKRVVYADELDGVPSLAPNASWLRSVVSAEAGVLAGPPASLHELDLATLVAARRRGVQPRTHPLARSDPVLARGYRCIAARAASRYGPWDGVIGKRPGLAPDGDRPWSPTALEAWAACPLSYFFARVLGLRDSKSPEPVERIDPRDRGSLVHTVLQQFVAEHPRATPDQAWSPEERDELRALAVKHLARAEADGLTGRPILWNRERRAILAELEATLDADEQVRSSRGLVPVHVELPFGRGDDERGQSGLPALALGTSDHRTVTFRGRIDRVDRVANGDGAGGLEVFDYKTGAAVHDPTRDPVAGGRRLQLATYALAVRSAYPDSPVRASYWFTRVGGPEGVVGFDLDEARPRIDSVIDTIVSAVGDGIFPAVPGADDHFHGRPTNCAYCPYDLLCPHDRVRRWRRRLEDPVLASYFALDPDGEL